MESLRSIHPGMYDETVEATKDHPLADEMVSGYDSGKISEGDIRKILYDYVILRELAKEIVELDVEANPFSVLLGTVLSNLKFLPMEILSYRLNKNGDA